MYSSDSIQAWQNQYWNNIETVLLDMDGTLLDLHFDNYFWLTHLPKRYAEEHLVSEEEAMAFITEHVEKYRGTLNWYCLDHWSDLVKLDIGKLKRELCHKIRPRPFAEEFLKSLRRLDKKVILITNAHPTGLNLKLEVTEIDRWLDIVISSHEFGHPKEDMAFWQHLQQREHFDPTSTLFIDDTPRILSSAKTFGIKYLTCINQPDSQKQPQASGEFIDIIDFDEILPLEK